MADDARSSEMPLISVVIPTYDHAHFLADAIESVLAQTMPAVEIVVVDDGSNDDPGEVVARYDGVRCVRQRNQGLAAARNTGIRESAGRYLVFLDADDRLLPGALEAGLNGLEAHQQAAFVSGRYRRVLHDGTRTLPPQIVPAPGEHYLALLRGNYIGMHGTVMYRREMLEAVGGFDTSLPVCEDYDLYLRIARRYLVATHDAIVAEYRIHDENMSANVELMLSTALRVLRTQWTYARNDPAMRSAYREGRRSWQRYYGQELVLSLRRARGRASGFERHLRAVSTLARFAPRELSTLGAKAAKRGLRRVAGKLLPRYANAHGTGANGEAPRIGKMRFGDFRSLTPASRHFGFDRGSPIDRYYIEAFLAHFAPDVHGRVLEIGDNEYTTRFGGDAVTRSDVLHATPDNDRATFVGDLAKGEMLPSDAFDCIILTQTLQLIYEVRMAMATLHRILRPGGTLLMTVPGTISQLEKGGWSASWCWGFTELSVRRLCSEFFPENQVETAVHGNVLTSVAFLYGLAAEELRPGELARTDPLYPLLITLRARKPAPPNVASGATNVKGTTSTMP